MMCWCRPEIRTPFCGRPECHPPGRYCAEHDFRGPPITGAYGPASLRCSKCGMSQAWFRVRSAFAPSARDEMNELKARISQLEREKAEVESECQYQKQMVRNAVEQIDHAITEADTLAREYLDLLADAQAALQACGRASIHGEPIALTIAERRVKG